MTGTVIDSLTVLLGLDTTAFKKGETDALAGNKRLRDDSSKTAKEVSGPNKEIAASFGRIKNEVLGVAAVLAGGAGLKELLTNSINVSASTGRMANNIGMATRELSAWGNLAKQVGGDSQATINSIFGISKAIELQKLGIQQTSIAAMQGQGIRFRGADGKELPISSILEQISALFHRDTPQQDVALGSIFGLDQGTINLLQTQTPAQLKAGLATQGSVSDADAKAAEALQKEWAILQAKLQDVENDIMKKLEPALLGVGTALEKVDWASFATSVGQMAESLKSVDWKSYADDINWLLSSNNFLNDAQKGIDSAGSDVHTWFMNFWKATNGAVPFATFMDSLLGTKVTPGAAAVRDQGMQFFEAQGASPKVAAAMMAQAQGESGFDPTALSLPDAHGNRAHGLFQWRGDRVAQFRSMFGMDPDKAPAALQFSFAWWELNNTRPAALAAMNAAPNAGAAGISATDLFEAPFGPNTTPAQRAIVEGQRASFAQYLAGMKYGGRSGGVPAVVNNVGDVVINMPPGTKADARTLSSAVRQRLMHEGLVAPANSGLQ